MRKILLTAIVLAVAGCGDQSGPVNVTPEMEARQRENQEQVNQAEMEWRKHPTIGDQEVEARMRNHDAQVRQAESAWRMQQLKPAK
jgi:predicted small lipoprotein YifL